MLPTTSILLSILTILVMIGSAHAQTSGPSSLRSSLTNQFERDRIDTLYSVRPPMVIGWNFGAAMRRANEDLRTNTYHGDFLTVILDRPGPADLAVVDLAGRTLIRATTDHSGVAEIDVSALPPAAYTIRATVEGHVLHAPFMIMRP